ncbi:MAG: hypothetical protein QMC85_04910 [Methanocellales archaeon]|nr:hypothetical protein [Methanocellales archaeon]MDI6859817.1 hypothetical protein [Methanocellales archaeon]MDI6903176.1 hypothetical protein [Methanocellales archaeon]
MKKVLDRLSEAAEKAARRAEERGVWVEREPTRVTRMDSTSLALFLVAIILLLYLLIYVARRFLL